MKIAGCSLSRWRERARVRVVNHSAVISAIRRKNMKKKQSSFFLILFLIIPLSAQAQMGDWLSKFRFDFGVQEDYTDNVDLRPTNTREDWITKIYAGIGFSTLRPVDRAPGQLEQAPRERDPWGVDLNYIFGYNYYANNTYDDYTSHEGRLDTWYTFDRRLTLRLREYLINSEEPRELQYAQGAPREVICRQHKQADRNTSAMSWSLPWNIGSVGRIW